MRIDYLMAEDWVQIKIAHPDHGCLSMDDVTEAICHGAANIHPARDRRGEHGDRFRAIGNTYDGRRVLTYVAQDPIDPTLFHLMSARKIS